MNRLTNSAIFSVALAIVFFGSVFSYLADADTGAALNLRSDGSVDPSQTGRHPSEIKSRGDDLSGDRSQDRDLEENRKRSHRNRGRDDRGILTQDDDHHDNERVRERHR